MRYEKRYGIYYLLDENTGDGCFVGDAAEVAILFSVDSAPDGGQEWVLHKHGDAEVVRGWAATVAKELRERGYERRADNLYVVASGQWAVADLNDIIANRYAIPHILGRLGMIRRTGGGWDLGGLRR